MHGGDVGKVVKTLSPLLQLSRRLWAAQHEHGEDRSLRLVEPERIVQQVAVLAGAAASPAGEPGPAAQSEAAQALDDRGLVVVDDRIAVGRLIAGEAQGVEREGVLIWRDPLLFDQAAEDADLDGVGLHAQPSSRSG